MTSEQQPEPYPSPAHISYNEDSRWCQDHGHTGLLAGSVCGLCDHLVATDPRFAAALEGHVNIGEAVAGAAHAVHELIQVHDPAEGPKLELGGELVDIGDGTYGMLTAYADEALRITVGPARPEEAEAMDLPSRVRVATFTTDQHALLTDLLRRTADANKGTSSYSPYAGLLAAVEAAY